MIMVWRNGYMPEGSVLVIYRDENDDRHGFCIDNQDVIDWDASSMRMIPCPDYEGQPDRYIKEKAWFDEMWIKYGFGKTKLLTDSEIQEVYGMPNRDVITGLLQKQLGVDPNADDVKKEFANFTDEEISDMYESKSVDSMTDTLKELLDIDKDEDWKSLYSSENESDTEFDNESNNEQHKDIYLQFAEQHKFKKENLYPDDDELSDGFKAAVRESAESLIKELLGMNDFFEYSMKNMYGLLEDPVPISFDIFKIRITALYAKMIKNNGDIYDDFLNCIESVVY